ncbi:MAG: GSU2403 family nucleotidyltransferase fold protein, partial [Dehalococcoidia bacterium]
MDDFAALARLLEALRPWLRHLVIVGGWAHRLHRFHPLANPPAYLSLRTRDADLAFSPTAPTVGDMAAALREAGFHQELSGEEAPPVTQYRLGVEDQDQGFYAEFLTPLRGSGAKRDGSPDATASRAGVTVQKLRFVEILLVHPSHLELGPEVGVPLGTPTEVMVPNPVSFIAQKLLIQTQRRPGKRPQDALY